MRIKRLFLDILSLKASEKMVNLGLNGAPYGENSKARATTEKAVSCVPTNLATFTGEIQRRSPLEDCEECTEICRVNLYFLWLLCHSLSFNIYMACTVSLRHLPPPLLLALQRQFMRSWKFDNIRVERVFKASSKGSSFLDGD